jgi:hypothetical protein
MHGHVNVKLRRVIGVIPTEWGKPVSQHRGLMLIRRNVETIAMELLITKCRNPEHQHAHTRVLLLQSALHATPSSNQRREQEMPRLLITNPSALLILNAAICASAARIVSSRYHVKYVRPPRGAGSGPPARADRLKVFTLNRKECHLQSGLGLGERVGLYSRQILIKVQTNTNICNIVGSRTVAI